MERLTQPPVYEPQQDLIRRTCRDAEELIANARDDAEAYSILDAACEEFRRECQSGIAILALREYLAGVIRNSPHPFPGNVKKDTPSDGAHG
jgi:hypothetical protein